MTKKDTERLVQQAMQQTIPDKEALWAKIESDLPAQPAFSGIRKTSRSKMRVVYSVMGAAACFLLIVGGLGIWQAARGSKTAMSENKMITADTPKNRDEPAAAPEDKQEQAGAAEEYGEAAAENEAPVMEGIYEDNAVSNDLEDVVGKQSLSPEINAAQSAAAEEPGDSTILSGTIYGDSVGVEADAALRTEAQEVLDAGTAYLLKEPPMTEEARANGVLLGFDLNGQEILLAAYDGRYQLIADGKAYAVPETGKALLDELTAGH